MSTDTVLSYDTSPQDPFDRALSLSELRVEAEQLILAMNRPVRRVLLRAGRNEVEVDWETTPNHASPTAPMSDPRGTMGSGAGGHREPTATTDQPTATITVRAPLVGTFYAAPNPGATPFVQVGDVVRAGDQIAIVEAMKLLNPVTADRPGKVTAIRVADGEMVEFDQVLLELEPVD
ncbi:acetyl-CoA carboxylase biotin carboxyl carrier protein [Actinosynnema sp. CA-248983]